MLTAEARAEVMARIASDGHDDRAAINAILASAFYLKGLVPIVRRGWHTFKTQYGEKTYEEYPGQLRGETGWLGAPSYMSSIDSACDLVVHALGEDWIPELRIRADGSEAQLHQFSPPCFRTKICRGGPGASGAATAIVKCVLEATETYTRNQDG